MAQVYKRAIDVYPVIESGLFLATRMMAICSHCLDYCTRMGMVYLKGVGYCLLFVSGSPKPYDDDGNSPTLLNNNPLSILGTDSLTRYSLVLDQNK